jgi:hypothetical protein
MVRLFAFGATAPIGPGLPHSWGFLGHTKRRTTVGRTPLEEWSARRRDLSKILLNESNTRRRRERVRQKVVQTQSTQQIHSSRSSDIWRASV